MDLNYSDTCQQSSTQFGSAWQGFVFPSQLGFLLEGVSSTNDMPVSIASSTIKESMVNTFHYYNFLSIKCLCYLVI